jgi:hypothetical protein
VTTRTLRARRNASRFRTSFYPPSAPSEIASTEMLKVGFRAVISFGLR